MWLTVLRKLYEAEQSEATAVIDTFLQKSVGVADHDNFVKTLKTNFDKLVHAKHAIDELDNIIKQSTKPEEKKKEK
jgi:hypothetical protein|tara:strand:+ start:504 stop:731 length:228 start_codon:yes stop_codon:yes gene_type:complete